MNKEVFINELQKNNRYIQNIFKLYKKSLKTNQTFQDDPTGINISDVYLDKRTIIKILRKELVKGHYSLSQLHEKKILIGRKVRQITHFSLIDRLILGVFYEILLEKTQHLLSPYVYSYIPGRSRNQAIHALADYLKQVRSKDKKLDVYILRADIQNYSETIPTDPHSIFWQYLYRVLDEIHNLKKRDYFRSLLEYALRPIWYTEEGLAYQKTMGIPMGSPLTTWVCTLYLMELDTALSAIPNSFYARYGDDFIFAHTEINQFNEAEQRIATILTQLRLQHNQNKKQCFYLTCAGKALPNSEHFIGSNKIDFCGLTLFADGTKTLSPLITNKMLHRIKQRLTNAAKILSHLDLDKKGQTLCQIANQLLDTENSLSDPTIKWVLKEVTNRGSLKQMDYVIALKIAELLSEIKGVRAFRKVTYATIRNRWHLISLCQEKNIRDHN